MTADRERAGGIQGRDLVYEVEAARLLDHVNVSAGRGEFLGLVGPNGAGKSTLLRVLGGLLRARGGEVAAGGRDISHLSSRNRARLLAHVPQIAPYTHGFTALEIVVMGRYPHMGRFQVEGARDRSVAVEAMRVTETENFADRQVSTLSGGEQQRVFVARALAQQPTVMLLDEPTSNLDIQHQVKVLQIVRGLVDDGLTAVAALHDLPMAARHCDRLVLLAQGRVVADGAPVDVLTSDNIEAAFGVRSVVSRNPLTGDLDLTVLHSASGKATAGEPRARVHVVCGGGVGARLMYRLVEAGYAVTAGALGSGDTDRAAAEALGLDFPSAHAFGQISDQAHQHHIELARSADVAVLCPVPLGPGNLRNVEALAHARRVIAIQPDTLGDRDYTGGEAAALVHRLNVAESAPDADGALLAVEKVIAEMSPK
ncbi:MAG: ABC transporter ATP-binding protein [Chloroflexota bacterium]